jgi:small subunit ribosomal protein S7
MSLPIPVPLAIRQRRRTAIRWIIDASDKRRDGQLPVRVAHEIVAVAEGRSSVWDRRSQAHRQGTTARSNLRWTSATSRRR